MNTYHVPHVSAAFQYLHLKIISKTRTELERMGVVLLWGQLLGKQGCL